MSAKTKMREVGHNEKVAPRIGEWVRTPNGEGQVVSIGPFAGQHIVTIYTPQNEWSDYFIIECEERHPDERDP